MECFMDYLLILILCLKFKEGISDINTLDARSSKYKGVKVFTVQISSDKDIEILRNLNKKYKNGVELWMQNLFKKEPAIFHVKPNLVNNVKNTLRKHKIRFRVYKDDMDKTIKGEMNKLRDPRFEEFGYNYAKHNSFRAMHNLLQGLTKKYRRISKLEVIGSTVERRPIYAVHISKSESRRKPVILIECGIHAREWSSFEVCFYFISELLKQRTQQVKTVTSKYDFVIIPALNPDGYVYTWTKDRMWRKNRSCSLPKEQCMEQCVGADINRNFEVNFCDEGASNQPCTNEYCGQNAFSEMESIAIKNMIARLRNRLFAYFAFHSFMSVWTYPWVKSTEMHPNFKEQERVAEIGAAAIAENDRTEYTVGNAAKVIYVVTGSSIDYAVDVGKAKYSYAIELRQGKKQQTGFIMREDEILPLCRETFSGLLNSILAMRPKRS